MYDCALANNSIGYNLAGSGSPDCNLEGDYTLATALVDSIVSGEAFETPIIAIWAAGNERAGQAVCGQYSTLPPPVPAKNPITVGAINSNDGSMTPFSAWGPTDDGRTKPDIVAPGDQSGFDGFTEHNNGPGGGVSAAGVAPHGRAITLGTSMAAPAVSGIVALMLEQHAVSYPSAPLPLPATVKAILVHTAEDIANVGPDYQSGYGAVRARRAVDQLIAELPREDRVDQDESAHYYVLVPADTDELRVTLAWDDVPGDPMMASALVNDLDLIIESPEEPSVRHYPWKLDPTSPSLGAVRPTGQSGEKNEVASYLDSINNVEQVVVDAPDSGLWTIRVRGTAVSEGPQRFSLVATPSLTGCTSKGQVALNRPVYMCEDQVVVRLRDCDLNSNDSTAETVQVTVTSTSDQIGTSVNLTETAPASGEFLGAFNLGDGSGATLEVAEGDLVTVEYLDVDDGEGSSNVLVVADAAVYCTSPMLSGGDPIVTPGSTTALIEFETEEPCRAMIRYGLSCSELVFESFLGPVRTNHQIELRQLLDGLTYYFEIDLIDAAGNVAIIDDTGDCFEFSTDDVDSRFTEQFFDPSKPFDLEFKRVEFFPVAGGDRYRACLSEISSLPVNPSGATSLSLTFGSYQKIVLSGNKVVRFYGQPHNHLFVGSSGYITFEQGDTDVSETIEDHFAMPRIAALFDNLNPAQGGDVGWEQMADRVVITWEAVPEFNESNSNTAQVELFFDGRIAISWLVVESDDGIVGLSEGVGAPVELIEQRFVALPECSSWPPIAMPLDVAVNVNDAVELSLSASDDGLPAASLDYVVQSLPTQGMLIDPGPMTQIISVPYTIASNGSELEYIPYLNCMFEDGFEYSADDGGSPPYGGSSELATVQIERGGRVVVYEFNLDRDPGWTATGDWEFGVPTGQGALSGDPHAGATGGNVYGTTLSGNYSNEIPSPPNAYTLTTDAIDCSGLVGVAAAFERWLVIESSEFDHASFEVSNDGTNFATVWEHRGGTLDDGEWVSGEGPYDIGAIADDEATVYLRWSLGPTDLDGAFPGWNIDDVRILANYPNNACPGDADGDNDVDFADLNVVIGNSNMSGFGLAGDLNCDGEVNFADINVVLGAMNTSCSAPLTPPVSVPKQ